MGVLDLFRRPTFSTDNLPQAFSVESGLSVDQLAKMVAGQSVEQLWRTQPYLRTVVTFIARNVAQLGLHTFQRIDENDRRRLRDDPVALALSAPNPDTTTFELIYATIADLALYDRAHWIVAEDPDRPSGWQIRQIPPAWIVGTGGGSVFAAGWYDVQSPNGSKHRVDAEQMLTFHGWNPGDPTSGSSPVAALRQILAEQVHAQAYRQQRWMNGGRVGAVLTRPAGVSWSDDARSRFAAAWKARWTGDNGPEAGGTPILEDGMTLQAVGFSAEQDQFIDAAKLSLQIVASVYHVNPTMVGQLDNANYSNVREFRRGLYGDTLGPTLGQFEDRVNTFLVPRLTKAPGVYVEFNIAEKLQGSFEEQAAVFSTAVGRPYMTADEARSRQNMPALGGDAAELVTPLNVLVGGQASPRDSGSQNVDPAADSPPEERSARLRVKAAAPPTVVEKAEQVLAAFFARQGRSVASAQGEWDDERWNRELADELAAVNVLAATAAGKATLEALGLDVDVYDESITLAWLRTAAEGQAEAINEATRAEVQAAVQDDEDSDPGGAVAALFTGVVAARAVQLARTQVTAMSGFGAREAVQQSGVKASKTWRVRSSNPRKSHARLDGESVPVGDTFSNGSRWPGDSKLSPDERSGCTCELEITREA